ncbi:MAG TPA: HesA/MoeB/ThiF family protein [Bacteroidales bacterium]|nr:HesA/MoeB/ThiF family protein [Bacteroidales bacterium]
MSNDILSNRELRRYNRQIMIPEIGIEGQEKLKKSKVLVIGAGGLGCPVLQYLSACGIGNIAIIDFDIVDETNLARQALYGASDLGKLKSIIAKNRLEYLNPLCEYTVINKKLDSSTSADFIKNYDVIVDATDHPEARYLINDACLVTGKPMVHGAIFKYESIVSVFNYNGGPSYRKFNPETIKNDYLNPLPSHVGFFGVLPGITGTYMANEVIKIITGSGEVLSGKILLINIFSNTFTTFTFEEKKEKERVMQPDDSMVTV